MASGEGWFHGCELQAALDSWRQDRSRGSFEVLEGWIPDVPRETLPEGQIGLSAAISKLYARSGSEPWVKPVLRAIYGKLAQKGGRWHDPYLSGLITARIRATILRAAMQHPAEIVEIATDCIRSTAPLDLPVGPELGQWKEVRETNLILVGPGFSMSDQRRRSRGIMADYVPWDEIKRQISRRNQLDVVARVPHFVGIGECVASGDWRHFLQWDEEEIHCRIDPGLADPSGRTLGRMRPDPSGWEAGGVRRMVPYRLSDISTTI
jgi:hypothetical protein